MTDTLDVHDAGTDTNTNVDTGAQPVSWVEKYGLDEDSTKVVSRFKSEKDLAVGYANMVKATGNSLALPKDDATDEEKSAAYAKIFSKLGRPESPDGYEFAKPEDLPQGLNWSDDLAKEVSKVFHSANFTKTQAQTAVNFYLELRKKEAAQVSESQTRMAQETTEQLKAEVGADKWDAYLGQARNAYEKFGGEELIALFDQNGLKNHPAVVRAFQNIYKAVLSEDHTIDGSPATKEAGGVFSDDFYKQPSTVAAV